MCKTITSKSGTDVEFCTDGCANLQPGVDGTGNNTNGSGTADGANIHKVTKLGLISLMFVITISLFHVRK